MPQYKVHYTSGKLKCVTYRQCPDVSHLAIHLNWMLENNNKNGIITINKIEVTNNYMSTGKIVQFLPWEYKHQYFIEDLEHRLLAYYMALEEQGVGAS